MKEKLEQLTKEQLIQLVIKLDSRINILTDRMSTASELLDEVSHSIGDIQDEIWYDYSVNNLDNIIKHEFKEDK